MLTQNGTLLGLAAALPGAALAAFMLTAPPAVDAQCAGCWANSLYYSCGYCIAGGCGNQGPALCDGGRWLCGCS